MREAATGHAWTRALARLVGLVVLSGTMTALFAAVSDARLPDSDGDGVADRVETRRLHTNPRKADTDRDKLRDGVEAHVTRTNPRRMDTDKDGLTDGFEVRRSKTKPRRFDTDGDRTGDGLELLMGRNPLVRDRPKKKLITDPVPPPPPLVPEPPLPVPDPPLVPDLLPPDTSISSGPSGTVATGSASFGFTSSEAGSTFECRLDAGAWGSCTSPKAYSGLASASHTFSVRATDASGNADITPASRTWTVNAPPPDTTAPDTTISSGPSGTSASASASFAFTSSESGSTFQCRLDAGSWGSCTSPKAYSGLANGSHTFDVRATDAAANTDASPASTTWTVAVPRPPPDTTAPDTTINSGPSGTVTTGSASFGFTSSETGSTFQCRLDAGAWGSCTSPKAYSGLANGSHTFDVRATDGAGNTDATPATRTWTVNVPPPDTTAPDTTITSGPSGTATTSFAFSSSETGSTFQCRMDGAAWATCASPRSYSGLANGSHTFDVRATDAAANTDQTPASRTWTVSVTQGAVTTVPPGGDLSAAYNQAADGSVIELQTGRYGVWETPSGTKRITVRAAAGAAPKLRSLHVNADNMTFDGLDLDAEGTTTVGAVYETSADNVTFRNGRIGNVVDEKGALLGGETAPDPRNLVIDNVVFHDVRPVAEGVHNECMYLMAPGTVVKNSHFGAVCGNTGAILTQRGSWWGQQPWNGATFLNNTFERQLYDHGSILFGNHCGDVGAVCRDIVIRGNTFNPASMPGNATPDLSYTNSFESCNTPRVDLPGITHEAC